MGVFGAIGNAMKAPIKAVNKPMKSAMGAANSMMGKAPKPPGMGGMGAVMGKMGIGPSKSPMQSQQGQMNMPITTPTSMNPMNANNQPEEMGPQPMMGPDTVGQMNGMVGAMNNNSQFAPPSAAPVPYQPEMNQSPLQRAGQMGQGIGPSFGRQDPMMRRRQQMM